ncbi:MAG: hypothetical protein Q8R83_08855 [Legionellaceae bacterium]|nr:hypothetical protein [Legionellaceae bacterium]
MYPAAWLATAATIVSFSIGLLAAGAACLLALALTAAVLSLVIGVVRCCVVGPAKATEEIRTAFEMR